MHIRVVSKGATPVVWDLKKGPCRIGRDVSNDLVVCEQGISRFHAELRLEGRAVILVDLDSSNGVYVDGQRLHRPTVLMPGETFTLGRTATLWFESLKQASITIKRKPPTQSGAALV